MTKLILATLFMTGTAFADDPPPHPHHGPPKEAVDACTSKAKGDACAFKMHDHDITGTCFAPPDKTVLACKPDHPPPHHDGDGPPPGPPPTE